MIDDRGPVQLNLLLPRLRHLGEFSFPTLPPGADVLTHPDARAWIAESVRDFVETIQDDHDKETTLRRALAWLLNQDDETLIRALSRGELTFPNADIEQKRRFLELLWERTFADWRYVTDPHDPDVEDPEVIGLPD